MNNLYDNNLWTSKVYSLRTLRKPPTEEKEENVCLIFQYINIESLNHAIEMNPRHYQEVHAS